jgi:hypothetical protein
MPKSKRSTTNRRPSKGRERHLSVRSELRAEPDIKKLARAVVALALAQAEADAQAQSQTRDTDEADQ